MSNSGTMNAIQEEILRRKIAQEDPTFPSFGEPKEDADVNREKAFAPTTQQAAPVQAASTGGGLGGNMQPGSAGAGNPGVVAAQPDAPGQVLAPGAGDQVRQPSSQEKADKLLALKIAMLKQASNS